MTTTMTEPLVDETLLDEARDLLQDPDPDPDETEALAVELEARTKETRKVGNRVVKMAGQDAGVHRKLAWRLRKRLEEVREERERAQAPQLVREAIEELREGVDRLEEAAKEYEAARSEVDALRHEVVRLRGLAGEDAEALDAETFARAGHALAHRLERRITPTGSPMDGDTTREHLFSSHDEALRMARALLPPPKPSVLDRIRKAFGMVTSTSTDAYRDREPSDRELAKRVTQWQRRRLELITSGSLEDVDDLDAPKPAA